MRPLTLFTLHSGVVSRLLEIDISQVQNAGHNLKHHGPVLCRDANHIHGMLVKQREAGHVNEGQRVGLLTPAVLRSRPPTAPVAKRKQEEVFGERIKEEPRGKRGVCEEKNERTSQTLGEGVQKNPALFICSTFFLKQQPSPTIVSWKSLLSLMSSTL